MAIEGQDAISKRIEEAKLIQNLGKRDLETPEGCGRDLRLGVIYEIVEPLIEDELPFIEADGAAGQGLRKGVKTRELARFQENSDKQEFVTVQPGQYRLVETVESVNTPRDLMPMVYPRSSLQRAGLLLITTKTDPGYSGPLTFGLKNEGPIGVRLQMGARIGNMVFYQIEGETISYRGQHQGGRVTSNEIERQV
jgi:deoxycytidine triphosphate deaminase